VIDVGSFEEIAARHPDFVNPTSSAATTSIRDYEPGKPSAIWS
jgi:hypothetical protein